MKRTLLLIVALGASACSGSVDGGSALNPASIDPPPANLNMVVGFDPGVPLPETAMTSGAVASGAAAAQLASETATAGGLVPASGGGDPRALAFFAFTTSRAADLMEPGGATLDREAPADTNDANDVFLAVVMADAVDERAFSQSLAAKFRHPRCVTCHMMRAPDTLAFATGPSHKGPTPGASFPAGPQCNLCHVNKLNTTSPVPGWQAPSEGFDFRRKSVAQLASMARNVPFDTEDGSHFKTDLRVLWALADGVSPFNEVGDDDHDGVAEATDTDGLVRTVPGGIPAFFAQIDAFMHSQRDGNAEATADVILASRTAGGAAPAAGASCSPSITYVPNAAFDPDDPTGTNPAGTVHVAFVSTAALSAADGSAAADVYTTSFELHVDQDPAGLGIAPGALDLRAVGTPVLVSAATPAGAGDADSAAPSISADGTRVAFESLATNLVAGFADVNGATASDVYVRDLGLGATALVSQAEGAPSSGGNGTSTLPRISADGAAVAFESAASDLIVLDANLVADVLYALLDAGGSVDDVFRASVASGGGEASGGDSSRASVFVRDALANDVVVAFQSAKTDLVAGATAATNVYLFDSGAGATTLLSQRLTAAGATPGNGDSLNPRLAPDGRAVAFESDATNLDARRPRDDNGARDVVLIDLDLFATAGVLAPSRVNVSTDGDEARAPLGDAGDAPADLPGGDSTCPQLAVFAAPAGLVGADFDLGLLSFATEAVNLGTSDNDNRVLAFLRETGATPPPAGGGANAAPTAVIDDPVLPADPVGAFAPIGFSAASSSDADGSITSCTWDFGDGTTSTLEAPTKSFDDAAGGTFSVTLAVIDDGGAMGTTQRDVVVLPNLQPTAALVSDAAGEVLLGAPVMFDASGSIDPDAGGALSFEFDFGDGDRASGAASAVSHAFLGEGSFAVTVTATDVLGAPSAPATVNVQVGPAASFANVYSVFQAGNQCIACHNGALPAGNLDFGTPAAAFAQLVGQTATCNPGLTLVVPGSAATSFLIDKVTACGAPPALCGGIMPPSGVCLSPSEIATIQSWINAGALADS